MSSNPSKGGNLTNPPTNLSQAQSKSALAQQQQQNEIHNLSVRQYLDQTVVPLLLQALNEAGKERPNDPIQFIVNYLRANNPEGKWTKSWSKVHFYYFLCNSIGNRCFLCFLGI